MAEVKPDRNLQVPRFKGKHTLTKFQGQDITDSNITWELYDTLVEHGPAHANLFYFPSIADLQHAEEDIQE